MSLQLVVPNEGPQSEAVVPFRWCISKGVLDVLKSQGAAEPLLLLTISHETKGEVHRALYGLGEAMAYVQLNQAGRHTFRATIVWSHWSTSKLRNKLLSKASIDCYAMNLYDNEGTYQEDYLRRVLLELNGGSIEEAVVTVSVGEEFFADEPAEWEKNWVNLLFSNPPRDQCQFRKRRIFAYTLQPVIVFITLTISVIYCLGLALIGLAVGIRVINWKTIVFLSDDPYDRVLTQIRNPEDLFEGKYNIYRSKQIGTNPWVTAPRSWWFMGLHPLIYIACAVTAYFTHRFGGWDLTRTVGLWAGLTIGTILTIIGIALMVKALWKARGAQQAEIMVKPKPMPPVDNLDDELDDVICEGAPLTPKVSALSWRRRTFHLRYLATKAKVCRPYRAV